LNLTRRCFIGLGLFVSSPGLLVLAAGCTEPNPGYVGRIGDPNVARDVGILADGKPFLATSDAGPRKDRTPPNDVSVDLSTSDVSADAAADIAPDMMLFDAMVDALADATNDGELDVRADAATDAAPQISWRTLAASMRQSCTVAATKPRLGATAIGCCAVYR
jgi:hypothetical protein